MDSKPRGANRSTKVAGKLKVLPEQPENLPILSANLKTPSKPTKDYESVGTTGDSEDGDIEESEESGDVEVCRYILTWYSVQPTVFISGVQSNFPYTGRSSSQGRVEIDEKKGQVFASSHCVCHSGVMAWIIFLNCANFAQFLSNERFDEIL